jgi:hypothetical protein
VVEKKVLKGIFSLQREEVTRGDEENEELHDLYFSLNIVTCTL